MENYQNGNLTVRFMFYGFIALWGLRLKPSLRTYFFKVSFYSSSPVQAFRKVSENLYKGDETTKLVLIPIHWRWDLNIIPVAHGH